MNQLYKGPLGEQWFDKPGRRALMEWAVNVKPGDLYHGCDAYNHVVSKSEIYYGIVAMETDDETGEVYGPCFNKHIKTNDLDNHSDWIVVEVDFQSEDGSCHTCPGGGCAEPPASLEEVKEWQQRAKSCEGDWNFTFVEIDERGCKK